MPVWLILLTPRTSKPVPRGSLALLVPCFGVVPNGDAGERDCREQENMSAKEAVREVRFAAHVRSQAPRLRHRCRRAEKLESMRHC